MALHVHSVQNYFGVVLLLSVFFLCESRLGFYPELSNLTTVSDSEGYPAGATWYGSPDGGGSDGRSRCYILKLHVGLPMEILLCISNDPTLVTDVIFP